MSFNDTQNRRSRHRRPHVATNNNDSGFLLNNAARPASAPVTATSATTSSASSNNASSLANERNEDVVTMTTSKSDTTNQINHRTVDDTSSTTTSPHQKILVKSKRIITMSQLRKAAIHASLSSPLKRLIVTSPIAQRIRHDILKSGEKIKPPLLLSSPPSQTNNNALVLSAPVSSSSRRQRLHESRFRRHSSVGAGEALDTAHHSASDTCTTSVGTKTPLSRYTSNFFSPPSRVQRLIQPNPTSVMASSSNKTTRSTAESPTTATLKLKSPPPQVVQTSTTTRSTTQNASAVVPKRHSTSTPQRTRRASHGRRSSYSSSVRSPLQALMAASNHQSPSPPGPRDNRKEPPSKLSLTSGSDGGGSHATMSATSTASTRRNLDKRTARVWHAAAFEAAIEQLKKQQSQDNHTNTTTTTPSSSVVSVVVRKRPLFPNERARGDFDVVAIPSLSNSCTVYKTMLEADMKTQTVVPHTYPCTFAFDERTTTLQIFATVVEPLLRDCLQPSPRTKTTTVTTPNTATILMFGQTGSGKSYTMSGLEQELAQRISYPLTLQCLEVSGKVCRDLLNDNHGSDTDDSDENHGKSPLRIVDHGVTSVVGAQAIAIDTPHQLLQLLALVKSRRATCATDRNTESSRSHSLCTLRFATGGSLTLVDCAGTERKNDSMHHTKDRRMESAEINTSLYALKECIRARASYQSSSTSPLDVSPKTRIPYRSSLLTRILRPHLEGRLVVIATIAPNATDTEHSIQTLETVSSLLGVTEHEGPKHSVAHPAPTSPSSSSSKLIPPKRWNHEQLVEFLQRKRLVLGSNPIPTTLTGSQVMRYNKLQLAHVLQLDSNDSDKLFHLLRAEASRIDRLELKRRMQWKKNP